MAIHHDTGNPFVSIVLAVFTGLITVTTSYTHLVPHSLQDVAYCIAIVSGVFSIVNVIVGWRKKK